MFGKSLIPVNQRKNSTSLKNSKKSKGFLEEDAKWAQSNDDDDEAISLLSFNSETENVQIDTPNDDVNGRLFIFLFLAVCMLTNILLTFTNCYNDTEFLQCIFTKNINIERPQDIVIHQVGNMAFSLLSIGVFWHVYQLQKRSFKIVNPKGFTKCFASNFVLGVLSTIFWISYIKINVQNSSNFEKSSTEAILLNLYLGTTLIYNLINQIFLKSRVEISKEGGNEWKKMLLFFIKNTYFFIMMGMLLILLSLQMAEKITLIESTEGIVLPLLKGYTDVMEKITVFASQFYVFLYFIDINYIYDGDFIFEERKKQYEKVLGLSML